MGEQRSIKKRKKNTATPCSRTFLHFWARPPVCKFSILLPDHWFEPSVRLFRTEFPSIRRWNIGHDVDHSLRPDDSIAGGNRMQKLFLNTKKQTFEMLSYIPDTWTSLRSLFQRYQVACAVIKFRDVGLVIGLKSQPALQPMIALALEAVSVAYVILFLSSSAVRFEY